MPVRERRKKIGAQVGLLHGGESPALKALLEVLDIFVEAGWPEARALTNRLEEIYR